MHATLDKGRKLNPMRDLELMLEILDRPLSVLTVSHQSDNSALGAFAGNLHEDRHAHGVSWRLMLLDIAPSHHLSCSPQAWCSESLVAILQLQPDRHPCRR